MKCKYLLFIGLFIVIHPMQALPDLTVDYKPVEVKGPPPDRFLEPIEAKIERAERVSKQAGESFDRELYLSTYLGRESLFLDGHILYNDVFTQYVNEVARKLVADKPDLLNELDIYVSRLPITNASAWVDGAIVIYMDLLGRYENEAQLAALLGHEIAHYTERHQIRKREYEAELERFSNRSGDLTRLLAQMEHSRDHEFEADILGYQRVDRSEYDAKEVVGSLEVLEQSIFPANYIPLNFWKVFSNENYTVDSAKVKTAIEVSEKDEQPSDYYSDESDSEVNREKLSTHPAISRRISVIKEREIQNPEGGSKFLVSEEKFNKISAMARFEAIDGLFFAGNYTRAFFEAVNLMESYPENRFLAKRAAKSMYYLAYYQTIENQDFIIPKKDDVPGAYYQALIKFFRAHNPEQFRELTYYYIRDMSEKFEDEPDIWIARGKIAELYLERSLAKEVYEGYLEKFPEGPHKNFVEFKLNNL